MDRVTASTMIAKIFAYLACGKREQARTWAVQLDGEPQGTVAAVAPAHALDGGAVRAAHHPGVSGL